MLVRSYWHFAHAVSGMFPCFRAGRGSLLFLAANSALTSLGLVS